MCSEAIAQSDKSAVAVHSFRLWKLKAYTGDADKYADDVAVHSFRLWKLKVEFIVRVRFRFHGCSSLVPIVETESFTGEYFIAVRDEQLQFTRSDCGN